LERNEDHQADFVEKMAQYDPEELGFLDEMSKDAHSIEDSMANLGKADKLRRNRFLFADDVPQPNLSSCLIGLLLEL
jgi:hypothetical protein